MIEVEKKFQPTEEQMKKLLEGAEFLGEKINHDIYYDYSDFRFLKRGIKLRCRNNHFELKARIATNSSEEAESEVEIENEEEISKYLNINEDLKSFVKNILISVIDYQTKRREYKKEGIIIDLDEMDFGYKLCEFEILVGKEEEIKGAKDKIMNFAKKHNIEIKNLSSKKAEYLRLFKPDLYARLKEGDLLK